MRAIFRSFVWTSAVLVMQTLSPSPVHAQVGGRYVLLVQGASGDPAYAVQHRHWLDSLKTTLRDRFGYDASHLFVLAETALAGEERSTAVAVKATLGRLAGTLRASDQLVVVFFGHGGGEGADAKFNLIGPDLSVTEWAELLKPITARLAVVDTTSASFPYLGGLAAPGRIVITATSTHAQRFHTVFPDGFVKAFSTDAADGDKNGRVSLLEAFIFASRSAKQFYEQKGTMATESALLDDDGDGKGRDAAAATGPDGSLAALLYLDGVTVPTSNDPEVQKLLTRQQALTEEVDELRRKQSTMPAGEFDREFERLMGELATVSREVRRRTGS